MFTSQQAAGRTLGATTKTLEIVADYWSSDVVYRLEVSGEITGMPDADLNGEIIASGGSMIEGRTNATLSHTIGYTGEITGLTIKESAGPDNVLFRGDEASRLSYDGSQWVVGRSGSGDSVAATERELYLSTDYWRGIEYQLTVSGEILQTPGIQDTASGGVLDATLGHTDDAHRIKYTGRVEDVTISRGLPDQLTVTKGDEATKVRDLIASITRDVDDAQAYVDKLKALEMELRDHQAKPYATGYQDEIQSLIDRLMREAGSVNMSYGGDLL